MAVFYLAGLTLLLIAALFAAMMTILFRRATSLAFPGLDWLDDFSLEKYGPLERLFDPADTRFLKAQAGYEPSIGKRFFEGRRAAAGLFLSELTADFDRLFRIAQEMVIYSREDRSGALSELIRQWFGFHLRVLELRLRLWLEPRGIAPVRPAKLLEAVARMRNTAQLALPSET